MLLAVAPLDLLPPAQALAGRRVEVVPLAGELLPPRQRGRLPVRPQVEITLATISIPCQPSSMHLMLPIKVVDFSINALSPNHGTPVSPIVIGPAINPRPCVCWAHQRCRRRSVGKIDINIPRDAVYLTAIGKLPILLVRNTRRGCPLILLVILSNPLSPT